MRRRTTPGVRRRRTLAAAVATAAILVAAGCIPYDVTGDLGADPVYVDATGAWRVAGTDEMIWTGPTPGGYGGPYAAPGNYDGEGRWEAAMVDVTTGVWTTAGERGTFVFAPPTDDWTSTPYLTSVVVGDYDGDGDTDPAYFSPDTATWYVEGREPFVWGRRTDTPGIPYMANPDSPLPDIPAPADYDGDGDTDPAVYRMETGEFLVEGQGAIRTTITYGQPVPANYTGAPGDEAAVLGMRGEGWAVEAEADPRPYAASTATWATPGDEDGDGDVELSSVTPAGSLVIWHTQRGGPLAIPNPIYPNPPLHFATRIPTARGTGLTTIAFASDFCIGRMTLGCPGDPPTVTTSDGTWRTFRHPGHYDVFAGRAGATPVMGDLDGDGTAEHMAYDPAAGEWVTDGARGTFTYAAPPDTDADLSTAVVPLVLDHDGDGDDDPAFYREADATWHLEGQGPIQHGRPTTTTPTFAGTPVHDLATPGDFDGDGTDELAVYRIDTGELVIDGAPTRDADWPTGYPLVGDHDGDGDDELGLYDPTTGTWYREGRAETTPFPVTGGLPLLVQSDGDLAHELSLVADPTTPGGTRTWWFEWRPAPSNPSLDPDLTPALGPNETRAADAFVRAYLAACVTTTPPPGDCT